ncbi:ABC transporter permease subunit [Actinotalea sp. BY-33]|uniref:ABC transporter permease subunit n=1 Tax=Actinotalea soli TaxID=2819234 RepID=A0A939RVZ8_9CELL|nr:ABC transporter permease subunit [Actinotalea soli]MBO1752920.1 ABC transporter permease subunit [Actinotalea soli]
MTRRTVVLALPVVAVLTIALAGPWLAPGGATTPVGSSFEAPTDSYPMGTDVLGRDALARLLVGGRVLVLQALAATLLGSAVGLGAGVWAGITHRRRLGLALMRSVDALAALPALLLLLLLATGAPGDDVVVAVGIAIVSAPFSVRVVHAGTARLVGTEYARHAAARGEPLLARVRRDIAPGLAPVALAEAGIRFVAATQLAATAGFLGLGAGAPTANWGRMVRENSVGVTMNALPVVVPAILLVALAVSLTVLVDRASVPTRLAPERIDRAA